MIVLNHITRMRGTWICVAGLVTDVRFVEEDHATVRRAAVEDVGRRIRRGVDTLLMLGLSRAFKARGEDPARHWLQVNGICLADRPLGSRP